MDNCQFYIGVLIILCLTAYFMWRVYRISVKNIAIEHEHTEQMHIINDKIIAQEKEFLELLHIFTEIRKQSVSTNPDKVKTTYADGRYVVKEVRYDVEECALTLCQDNMAIIGYISLMDKNDRKAFIESLHRHECNDKLPYSLDLRLNVVHTKDRLLYAQILEEGMPREGKTCLPLGAIVA